MMHKGTSGYMRSYTRRFYLRDSCVIEAAQKTKDANFMNVTAWVTVATVKCRLIPAGSVDAERAEVFANQQSIKVVKRIVVPHDTALDAGQRVTVNAEIYQVAALDVGNTDEVFRQAVIVQMAGADNDG